MPDREKVIKGLECCMNEYTVCRVCGCPYYGRGDNLHDCYEKLSTDAIALLKAQEPVEPIASEYTALDNRKKLHIVCGNCCRCINEDDSYCWHCGRAVKWD